MSQTGMPQVDDDERHDECGVLWWAQRIELAGALTSEHHRSRRKILNGEAMRVKFNRDVIVTSKFTNGNEILHIRRRDKNIVQMNGGRSSGNGGSGRVRYWQLSTIANDDRGREMKRANGVEITRVGGYVRRSTGVEEPIGGA